MLGRLRNRGGSEGDGLQACIGFSVPVLRSDWGFMGCPICRFSMPAAVGDGDHLTERSED